ncbi:hypothetical protein [Microvirga sp. VF16]|uniref:hypothetical protein n=1 Tax=Microvirga sp. VF16 TaxID=2807101 RepID=UPI00193CF483|nr:hypothetical protein [Microvirga sp. VF16]QRM28520.1 hypothetical protein JO965_20150 [Microvirga sp. VF16]
MKPASRRREDPIEFACCGALVGMVLFALHDTYMITADTSDVTDFTSFFVSMTIFVTCGASAFAAAVCLRNRRLRSASSELLPDEWVRERANEEAGYFNDVIISIQCRPLNETGAIEQANGSREQV